MSGDDKTFAICAAAIFIGAIGSLATPWALLAAALAIAAIAHAPTESDDDE